MSLAKEARSLVKFYPLNHIWKA